MQGPGPPCPGGAALRWPLLGLGAPRTHLDPTSAPSCPAQTPPVVPINALTDPRGGLQDWHPGLLPERPSPTPSLPNPELLGLRVHSRGRPQPGGQNSHPCTHPVIARVYFLSERNVGAAFLLPVCPALGRELPRAGVRRSVYPCLQSARLHKALGVRHTKHTLSWEQTVRARTHTCAAVWQGVPGAPLKTRAKVWVTRASGLRGWGGGAVRRHGHPCGSISKCSLTVQPLHLCACACESTVWLQGVQGHPRDSTGSCANVHP